MKICLCWTPENSISDIAKNENDKIKPKLDEKKIDPFKIEAKINNSVAKLALTSSLSKLHSSFYIDLLSHFVQVS